MSVDMEKQFTTRKSDAYRKYDEEFLDVHSLFPGINPDLYHLQLSQPDELAAVGCSETDEDHLGLQFPSIGPIPIRANKRSRSVELDSLEFLNFEEYADSTKTSSGSCSKTDTPNWPFSSSTSANPLDEASEAVRVQQDDVHRDHYQRADNLKFHLLVDTATHSEHHLQGPALAKNGICSEHVAAHCQDDTSAFAASKGEEENHNNVLPATGKVRPQEPVPCPRCRSPNTKFCYYNNYNRNQPRHFCRSCKTQWTVGGNLRLRSPKSKGGQTARRGRNSSRMDVESSRESGTKEPGKQLLSSCGDLLTTGIGQVHPNRGRTRVEQPILAIAGDTQGLTPQQREGKKRKDGPSSIHLPASELPLLSYSNSGPGEIPNAAARIPSISSFSQLSSVPRLWSNSGAFLPSNSLTAKVVRLASGGRVAIQLAQTPGSPTDINEVGPGFQALTPTAATRSVSALGEEYESVTVGSLHQPEDTPFEGTSFIPNDLLFQDVGFPSPGAPLSLGQDWTEISMGTTVTPDTNDSHSMSKNATMATQRDLKLKVATQESILQDLIANPSLYMTSTLELGTECQLNTNSSASSRYKFTCTCGPPSSSLNSTRTLEFPSLLDFI